MWYLVVGWGAAALGLTVGWVLRARVPRDSGPPVLCAACRTEQRQGVPHQLYVEVWDCHGVMRHKWPVGVRGGVQPLDNSVLVDEPRVLARWADELAGLVAAAYHQGRV